MPFSINAWLALVGLLCFMPAVFAQPKAAPDWPTFRGNPLQTGVALSPLPNVLVVRWSYPAKTNLESSAIISEQTVFFAGGNGKLHALDLATGKKKWDYPTAGISAAPAARAGAVYFGDAKGNFHCVDAATGKRRWIVETDGPISGAANFGPDQIVFGSDDHHLYCVSTAGKVLWKYETREKIRAAPAVVGDHILVGGCDHTLHIIDRVKGEELATVPLGGHIAASAAVREDYAYVGTMANQFLAVDWKKGAILWQFEAKRGAQPFFASAAVADDLVVAASRDKNVRALQRQTGKETWTFATKGRMDGSPVIVGKRVLVASHDGHLYMLDLARGAELARFDLGGPTAATPAIGGECVVMTTITGDVICLGAKK